MKNILVLGLFLLSGTFALEANEAPAEDCHALACEYLEWYEDIMSGTSYDPEEIYTFAYDGCTGNQQ